MKAISVISIKVIKVMPIIKVISATNSVKYNTRKKLTYYSQFRTNFNRISLSILENLVLKKDDFIKNKDVTSN